MATTTTRRRRSLIISKVLRLRCWSEGFEGPESGFLYILTDQKVALLTHALGNTTFRDIISVLGDVAAFELEILMYVRRKTGHFTI